MIHYTRALTYIAVLILLLSCFQIKQRQENFNVACAEFNINTIEAINAEGALLIGGIDSSDFNLNTETTTQLVKQVTEQWIAAGYTQTKTAYQSWAELGMKSNNNFMRSFNNQTPLSQALINHFLTFDDRAKLLLYANIEAKTNTPKNSTTQYANLQTVTIHYKLWELGNGNPILDSRVYGYSYKGNEKHISDQDSFGKELLEDMVYFVAYEGVPELTTTHTFVEKTTHQFIELVNKIKSALNSKDKTRLGELQITCQ